MLQCTKSKVYIRTSTYSISASKMAPILGAICQLWCFQSHVASSNIGSTWRTGVPLKQLASTYELVQAWHTSFACWDQAAKQWFKLANRPTCQIILRTTWIHSTEVAMSHEKHWTNPSCPLVNWCSYIYGQHEKVLVKCFDDFGSVPVLDYILRHAVVWCHFHSPTHQIYAHKYICMYIYISICKMQYMYM